MGQPAVGAWLDGRLAAGAQLRRLLRCHAAAACAGMAAGSAAAPVRRERTSLGAGGLLGGASGWAGLQRQRVQPPTPQPALESRAVGEAWMWRAQVLPRLQPRQGLLCAASGAGAPAAVTSVGAATTAPSAGLGGAAVVQFRVLSTGAGAHAARAAVGAGDAARVLGALLPFGPRTVPKWPPAGAAAVAVAVITGTCAAFAAAN